MILVKKILQFTIKLYLRVFVEIFSIFNNNIIFFYSSGYGDYIQFILENYQKIEEKNLKVFCFSEYQFEILNYFLKKKNIYKFHFLLPKPYHASIIYSNFNNFKSIKRKIIKLNSTPQSNLTKEKFIRQKIDENSYPDNINKFSKQNYVCLFLKFYNNDVNSVAFSTSRQTTNIFKFISIIEFLNKLNYKVIILGTNKDLGVIKLSNILKKSDKILNYEFYTDIDPDYNFRNLVFICSNSKFYIGNASGAIEIYYYLRNKALIFDSIDDGYYNKYVLDDRVYLLKKIKINDEKEKILDWLTVYQILDNQITNYEIIENSYLEIEKELKKLI